MHRSPKPHSTAQQLTTAPSCLQTSLLRRGSSSTTSSRQSKFSYPSRPPNPSHSSSSSSSGSGSGGRAPSTAGRSTTSSQREELNKTADPLDLFVKEQRIGQSASDRVAAGCGRVCVAVRALWPPSWAGRGPVIATGREERRADLSPIGIPGKGSFGEVYKGYSKRTGKAVAIKSECRVVFCLFVWRTSVLSEPSVTPQSATHRPLHRRSTTGR